MASEPVRQFDDQSMRRIAAAVRKVEQTPVMRPSVGVDRPSPQARVIRWGRTTTSYEYPTYPSSGPAYVVELGEYGLSPDPVYPGATVSKSFTAYDPSWKVVAVDPSGGTWAENTVVRIERHGDQWWIRPTAATTPVNGCIRIRLGGGSGLVYANGSSSSMSSPYTIDQYGIWLFPGSVEGISTNSLGTIFTAPTPTAYYDNAIEVGQKNHYMVTLHTTWRLPPETLSSARLRFRAASHTHDYTDNGGAMVTGATSPDSRALDDGVNVQVASYITDGLGTSQFAGMSSTNLWYGSDDYRYCHHTGVADIICTSTLLHMRFKVVRMDASSYGAPELHSAYALIQQVGEPTL